MDTGAEPEREVEGYTFDGQFYRFKLSSFIEPIKTYSKDKNITSTLSLLDNMIQYCSNDNDTLEKVEKFISYLRNKHFLTSDVREKIYQLKKELEVEETEYCSISDKFVELYNSKVNHKGISFLCPKLDELTGGIVSGTICTLAGAPGSMKTTTALNICYNAVREGKNVVYFSLEETPFRLFEKLLSRVSVDSGVPLSVSDISQDKLDTNDKTNLFNKVLPYLNSLSGDLYIIGEEDLVNYETITIEKKLKEIDELAKWRTLEKRGEENHGIDLVVIDYVQLLKYASSEKDEFSVINMYVSFFRRQALSFLNEKREVAVLLLSQVNREGVTYAQRHDGRYQMQHIAEASELERSSTYVITVYADATTQLSKLLKIGAVKLRNAPLPMDTINVFADGEYYHVGISPTPTQKEYNISDIESSSVNVLPEENEDELPDKLKNVLGELFN